MFPSTPLARFAAKPPIDRKGRNGYLALRPSPESAKYIAEQVAAAGIKNGIPADKLHVTLYYAPTGLPHAIHGTVKPETVHVAFAKSSPRLLGEDPWRALVLELDAPSVAARHAEIKATTGVSHSFPDYLPHLSLKYDVEAGDLEKLRGLRSLFSMAIDLTGEYCEDLD